MPVATLALLLSVSAPVTMSSYGVAVMSQKSPDKPKGSGVIIAPGVLLTAAHVAGAVDSKQIIRCNGKDVQAEVAARTEAFDLAVLVFPAEGTECDAMGMPVLATDDPKLGAALTIDGFPAGVHLLVRGTVSGYQPILVSKNSVRYSLIADAKVFPGSSGSGIVDTSGRLVGILTGRFCMDDPVQPPGCFASAAPASLIKLFLGP